MIVRLITFSYICSLYKAKDVSLGGICNMHKDTCKDGCCAQVAEIKKGTDAVSSDYGLCVKDKSAEFVEVTSPATVATTEKEFKASTKYYTMHACPIPTPKVKEECADLDWINKQTGKGCI